MSWRLQLAGVQPTSRERHMPTTTYTLEHTKHVVFHLSINDGQHLNSQQYLNWVPMLNLLLCRKNKHAMILVMVLASPHSHMYLVHHQNFNVDLAYVGHLTTKGFKNFIFYCVPHDNEWFCLLHVTSISWTRKSSHYFSNTSIIFPSPKSKSKNVGGNNHQMHLQ